MGRVSVAAEPTAPPPSKPGADRRFRTPSRSQLHAVIEGQRILACAPPDPEIIFRLLAETAWSVLRCTGVISSQPTSDTIIVRGVAGERPTGLGSTIPLDGTLTGVAVRTRTSQLCDDWLQDPRTGVKTDHRPAVVHRRTPDLRGGGHRPAGRAEASSHASIAVGRGRWLSRKAHSTHIGLFRARPERLQPSIGPARDPRGTTPEGRAFGLG